MGKLKNGKAAGKDDITGKLIKGEGNRVLDWIWRLYNMAFESGVELENWRSAVIIPLYKSIGERRECSKSSRMIWVKFIFPRDKVCWYVCCSVWPYQMMVKKRKSSGMTLVRF